MENSNESTVLPFMLLVFITHLLCFVYVFDKVGSFMIGLIH